MPSHLKLDICSENLAENSVMLQSSQNTAEKSPGSPPLDLDPQLKW